MKKYLIILGVATLAFLGGCQAVNVSTSPEPVIADEANEFELIGNTKSPCYSYLYKYVDEEAGKIIYMYHGGGGSGLTGTGIAVTDIGSK